MQVDKHKRRLLLGLWFGVAVARARKESIDYSERVEANCKLLILIMMNS